MLLTNTGYKKISFSVDRRDKKPFLDMIKNFEALRDRLVVINMAIIQLNSIEILKKKSLKILLISLMWLVRIDLFVKKKYQLNHISPYLNGMGLCFTKVK